MYILLFCIHGNDITDIMGINYCPIRRSRNHHSLTFQTPLQELTFTRAHSSLKQSEIGMPFQIRSLPLLKEQRMVWLGLPVWCELGTNFPYHRSWGMNVIRRITSKHSDSDSAGILRMHSRTNSKSSTSSNRFPRKTDVVGVWNPSLCLVTHVQLLYFQQNIKTPGCRYL